jgi:hypothetical protein
VSFIKFSFFYFLYTPQTLTKSSKIDDQFRKEHATGTEDNDTVPSFSRVSQFKRTGKNATTSLSTAGVCQIINDCQRKKRIRAAGEHPRVLPEILHGACTSSASVSPPPNMGDDKPKRPSREIHMTQAVPSDDNVTKTKGTTISTAQNDLEERK